MKEFSKLLEIIERLLGPDGCPWDREQTLNSMRSSVLEEVYEVIHAIESNNEGEIKEELGDLFFNVVFLSKLGEKEKLFRLNEVLTSINEKLIRRHPHVFGEVKELKTEEVLAQWNKIKIEEKSKKTTSPLDEIPKGLPALLRAKKMLKILKKHHHPLPKPISNEKLFEDEKSLGDFLLQVMLLAEEKKLNAEIALNAALNKLSQEFDPLKDKKE